MMTLIFVVFCFVLFCFFDSQFFFQLKGDMCLKIVEKDAHKDIPIKEGEVQLNHVS